MLITLSPAKSLDFDTPPPAWPHTQPRLLDQSAALIERLRDFSPAELARLMALSDALASLNVGRNLAWQTPFTPDNARVALSAFNGDVYEGLDARSLSADEMNFAQRHVRILSGLYGVLRPLDLMQPYRLEMGTRLDTARGRDLYAFWGDRITQALSEDLEATGSAVLVNLASEEYFKSVRPRALDATLITPVFEDYKNGRFKIISFFAKRARGLMTRYAIEHAITDPEALKDFDREGYRFEPTASDAQRWVFRRKETA